MPITIVIADDHDVIREGMKSILGAYAEYKVVGEAGNGEEAVSKAGEHKPDILLLDISMPKRSGLDVISQVQHASPKTKIIIITVHRANIYINKALKSGVKGYLHKENVVEDLIPALRRVSRGEVYVSSKVSQYLVERLGEKGTAKETKLKKELLTEREADVLRLVAEGKTAKEIGEVLFLSPRTVENYKNTLLEKLGLHRSIDLIKYAIENKIVETEA